MRNEALMIYLLKQALYVSKFFKPKSYGKMPLLPQNGLGDVELQRNYSETSDQQEIRLPSM
jgi:hypothetical protein